MAITFTVATGLEANLPANGAVAGRPFLTTDTRRLLFGAGVETSLVPLNVRLEDVLNLLVGDKLDPSLLPSIAIASVRGVADIAERDALLAAGDVQEGDTIVVADRGDGRRSTYILAGDGSWLESSSEGAVASVNNQSGQVVLTTDNINEGLTRLYYSDARVGQYLAGIINVAGGVAGVNAQGYLSVSQLPPSVVRAGDDATRLGSGTSPPGALLASVGDGSTEWTTTIDGGTF